MWSAPRIEGTRPADYHGRLAPRRGPRQSADMIQLVSATPSPYARKVRIALAEKGVPFELVTTVPWNADTITSEHNPLEKIPILIADDGEAWYESRFILEYIEVAHPEPPLLPRDPRAALAARRFEVLADGVCDAGVLTFFERQRPEQCRSGAWLARQRRKIDGGIAEIARLAPEDGYCVENRFGLADIAVGSALGWLALRMPDLDWQSRHPNLVRLCERLETRESFRATVPVAQVIRDAVV